MPKYNTRKFNLISSVKWKKIFIFFVFKITLFGSHAMSDCAVAILFCKLKFLLLLQNVMKTIKPFFLCFFFFVHTYNHVNQFVICVSLYMQTNMYQQKLILQVHIPVCF